MPPEIVICDDCGSTHKVCPECRRRQVSEDLQDTRNAPDEVGGETPSPRHSRFARRGSDGASYRFKHMCWACGWNEERVVSVEVVDNE